LRKSRIGSARIRWAAPTFSKIYVNKNPLLGTYRGADGVKTGWTTKAGAEGSPAGPQIEPPMRGGFAPAMVEPAVEVEVIREVEMPPPPGAAGYPPPEPAYPEPDPSPTPALTPTPPP
jgi:hypothetical protein